MPGPDPRSLLRPDCQRCAALCCVGLAFSRSAQFAFTKSAGVACHHLRDDFACSIHADLRDFGFPGCVAFGCFGAGQHVVQVIYAGRSWRTDPALAASMFTVFDAVRDLNEIVWLLLEALDLLPAGVLQHEVAEVLRGVEATISASAEDLERFDAVSFRHAIGELLERVSLAVRSQAGALGPDHRGGELSGAALRAAPLRGADLRAARLVGADLTGSDLAYADLLGADLRAADLRGADLAHSLFLTQPQIDAAVGDGSTTLPSVLDRPSHWSRSRWSPNT